MSEEYFLIDAGQLRALRQVATRLHSEDRLNGDQMRDLGHTVLSVVEVCSEIPLPPSGVPDAPERGR